MTNEQIARELVEYANQLEREGASLFRVRAFRRGAEVARAEERPLADRIRDKGRKGLEELPGIGTSIAFAIESLVRTGVLHPLRPVDAHCDPKSKVTSLPRVGPILAHQLHERLGVTTIADLARVEEEGRLPEAGLEGKRLTDLRRALGNRAQHDQSASPHAEPSIEELLRVDAEYRQHVEEHELPMITPRRFNPERERWLPIFRAERDGWRYRVLFSNTSLAHRLGKTRDWVVIYFERGDVTGQRTVVTETRGDLAERRMVRGRERECRLHYLALTPSRFEPEPEPAA